MIRDTPVHWDREVDVVVVGSGGAAMTAATLAHDGGAEVLIVEKDVKLGGTTGVSGGVMWLPQNHHMAAAGIEDSREDAIAYIERLARDHQHDPALVEVWVDAAPRALAYLEAHTPVRMMTVPDFPDYYHPFDVPGKRPGGRSVEPVPYAVADELPEWKDRLNNRIADPTLGGSSTLAEDMAGRAGGAGATAEVLADRAARDIRTKGPALIGRLFRGLVDRGVDVLLGTPARALVMRDGEVQGVRCETPDGPITIGARKGVVLACGGFEWNRELVETFIGYEIKPLSPGGNVGDGLLMAMEAGAALGNMNSYWGQPAMLHPEIVRDGEPVPQFECGRGEPGTIIVNRAGRRFANESLPYNDFPKAFGQFDPTAVGFANAAPAWQIFDHGVKTSLAILGVGPDDPAPAWMHESETMRELAAKLHIDPDALAATVELFDDHAARGEDPDFQRHKVGLMGPGRLRPLDQAPFYAVEIHPGALGTNGGPRLDEHGRVRRASGGVVPGLYAAGNTAANTFGWAYPSGGGTIGNGVVFGFLAGQHVAKQPARSLERPGRDSGEES